MSKNSQLCAWWVIEVVLTDDDIMRQEKKKIYRTVIKNIASVLAAFIIEIDGEYGVSLGDGFGVGTFTPLDTVLRFRGSYWL